MNWFNSMMDGHFKEGCIYRCPLSIFALGAGRTKFDIFPGPANFVVLSDGIIFKNTTLPDQGVGMFILWNGSIVWVTLTVGSLYEIQTVDGNFVL